MGLFPCTVHGVRFRGMASHFYGFRSAADSSTRSHLRLCRDCSVDVAELASRTLAEVSPDDGVAYPEAVQCCGCSQPLESSYDTVILTGYPLKDDKRQWIGYMHRECGPPGWFEDLHRKGLQKAA